MKTKHCVLGVLIILGLLVQGSNSVANSPETAPRPAGASLGEIRKSENSACPQELRRQKNKRFIQGMSSLPNKIEALMKKSPDFSGS